MLSSIFIYPSKVVYPSMSIFSMTLLYNCPQCWPICHSTSTNWLLLNCLPEICKLLKIWFSNMWQLLHWLPLSNIHISWEYLSQMDYNNALSDVDSSSSSSIYTSSLSFSSWILSSSWALTSSSSTIWVLTLFFPVNSSWSFSTANHESRIPWTRSSFTYSSCFSLLLQTLLCLSSIFYFMGGMIMIFQFWSMCP